MIFWVLVVFYWWDPQTSKFLDHQKCTLHSFLPATLKAAELNTQIISTSDLQMLLLTQEVRCAASLPVVFSGLTRGHCSVQNCRLDCALHTAGIHQIYLHIHKTIFNKTCLPCPQSPSTLVQCSHTGFFGFFGAYLLDGLMQYKVCGNTQGICGYVQMTPPAFFNVWDCDIFTHWPLGLSVWPPPVKTGNVTAMWHFSLCSRAAVEKSCSCHHIQ